MAREMDPLADREHREADIPLQVHIAGIITCQIQFARSVPCKILLELAVSTTIDIGIELACGLDPSNEVTGMVTV